MTAMKIIIQKKIIICSNSQLSNFKKLTLKILFKKFKVSTKKNKIITLLKKFLTMIIPKIIPKIINLKIIF